MLKENPELFKREARRNPALLETKWMESESLLHFPVVERDCEKVRFLAGLGAQLNVLKKEGGTPLHSAILSNDHVGVKLLLELGADPSIRNGATCDALEWASFVNADPGLHPILTDPHFNREDRSQRWRRIAADAEAHPEWLAVALENLSLWERWERRGRVHAEPILEWRRHIHAAQNDAAAFQNLLTYQREDNHNSEPLKSCSPLVGFPPEPTPPT